MINCIITDDEPIAQDIIETYVSKIPTLNLVAKCDNALDTLTYIQNNQVDLIFLRIEMPEISGLEFLKTLSNPPFVIFTTAFQEYALQGYEFDVVDYLLKPISFDRFLKGVNKVHARIDGPAPIKTALPIDPPTEGPNQDYFFVKADHEMIKINFQDLLYVEGCKDYVKIYCKNRRVMTLGTMKAMDDLLYPSNFLRVHRSFIVNLDKIESVVGNSFRVGDAIVDIGKSYRKSVLELVKEKLY